MVTQGLAATSGTANSIIVLTHVITSTMIELNAAANHTITIHTCVTPKETANTILTAAAVETAIAQVLVQAQVKTSAGTTITISVSVITLTAAAMTVIAAHAKMLTVQIQNRSKLKLSLAEAADTTTRAVQCVERSFQHISYAKHLVHSA